MTVDGHNLTVAAVVAAARYSATVKLDDSQAIKDRVQKSRQVVVDKVKSGASIYGLSTGFGGSGKFRCPLWVLRLLTRDYAQPTLAPMSL